MNRLADFTLRLSNPAEIEAPLLTAWEELEARASVPNAFLSPHFVLPAIRHLTGAENVLGAFIERRSGGRVTLIGAALFQVQSRSRRFPLPHLRAFASIHSYLTGFLLDSDYTAEASQILARFLASNRYRWHGVYFENCPQEWMAAPETQAAFGESGLRWQATARWQRPVLRPSQDKLSDLLQVSRHSLKDYQRNLRHLQAIGRFEWKALRGHEPIETSLTAFLQLENMGWKERQRSALAANPAHLRFFEEMSAAFQRAGRLCITELRLDENILASTVNLISGRAGFGFKLGWDTRYARYSPGIVNLMQIIEHAQEAFGDLDYLDSSADPDSYVGKIWSARRDLTDGWLMLSPLANAALTGLRWAQKIKRKLQ